MGKGRLFIALVSTVSITSMLTTVSFDAAGRTPNVRQALTPRVSMLLPLPPLRPAPAVVREMPQPESPAVSTVKAEPSPPKFRAPKRKPVKFVSTVDISKYPPAPPPPPRVPVARVESQTLKPLN